jgi:hypothetical protein
LFLKFFGFFGSILFFVSLGLSFGLGAWSSSGWVASGLLARGLVVLRFGGWEPSGQGAGVLPFWWMRVFGLGSCWSSVSVDGSPLARGQVFFPLGGCGSSGWGDGGILLGLLGAVGVVFCTSGLGPLWQGTLTWGGSSGKEIMGLSPGRRFLEDRSIMRVKHLATGVSCGGRLLRQGLFY